METPKLMICIGKDKNEQPIYKEVKKLIIQYIDENNTMTRSKKIKPFWNGQGWLIKAFDKLFCVSHNSIYFDEKLNYYILVKEIPYIR